MAIGVEEPPTSPQKTDINTIQPFATPPASPPPASHPSHSPKKSSPSLATPPPRRAVKRRERSESLDYSPPSSVQSLDSSSCCSSTITARPTPKRRGRPPKSATRPLSPTELEQMDPSDARYMQMRNKNNEASRRSRINRKERELELESESSQLMEEHSRLSELEQRLAQKVKRFEVALKASWGSMH